MTDLTIHKALEFLFGLGAGPLRFGDAAQIEAVNQIKLAEDLIGTSRQCPECDGNGEREKDDGEPEYCLNCGRACPYCSGSTSTHEECEMCEGERVITWKRETVYAMRVSAILKQLNPPREIAA